MDADYLITRMTNARRTLTIWGIVCWCIIGVLAFSQWSDLEKNDMREKRDAALETHNKAVANYYEQKILQTKITFSIPYIKGEAAEALAFLALVYIAPLAALGAFLKFKFYFDHCPSPLSRLDKYDRRQWNFWEFYSQLIWLFPAPFTFLFGAMILINMISG